MGALLLLATAGGLMLYVARSKGMARRKPFVSAIPVPQSHEELFPLRAAICQAAPLATPETLAVEALSRVYGDYFIVWPAIPGDHASLHTVQALADELVKDYYADPQEFCPTT